MKNSVPKLSAKHRLAEWAMPEEIAWAVGFLASERSGFITGQVLTVDGGLIM